MHFFLHNNATQGRSYEIGDPTLVVKTGP